MPVESQITARKRELETRIADLRGSTMRFTHMGRDGKLKVTDEEKLAAVNSEVTEVESKIATIDSVVSEMQQLYKSHGIGSFRELNTKGKNCHDIVTSAAPRAWQSFTLVRGQGRPEPGRDRTGWLVGDIIALDEYKQQEDQIRSERDTAKAKEAALRETRDRLLAMFKSIGVESTSDDFAS
jgi:hypothetical protein